MEADLLGQALGAMIHAAAEASDRFGALAEVVLSGQVGDSSGFTNLLSKVLRSGIRQGRFRVDLDVPVAVLESAINSGAFLRLASPAFQHRRCARAG